MPTIKQLIRNTRQQIKNVTNSPLFGDALNVEEHVLGCIKFKFTFLNEMHGKIVVGKVIVAKAIGIFILYIGLIRFVINRD
ncbi:hypothetical protein Scep_002239 [Stephania cephalantha]|uniref:Uncharacterized protein n=1 Tax=Stephania cephalantha TaxID=152367 RepID=A0AAP0Q4S6_9MAGN